MYAKVCGNNALFAIGFFLLDKDINIGDLVKFMIIDNKIIVFDKYEYDTVCNILNKNNILYIYNELNYSDYKKRTTNISFNSLTELNDFIKKGIEPKSQIIPNIKKDKYLLGQESVKQELNNLKLQQINNILGNIVVELELKLLELGG